MKRDVKPIGELNQPAPRIITIDLDMPARKRGGVFVHLGRKSQRSLKAVKNAGESISDFVRAAVLLEIERRRQADRAFRCGACLGAAGTHADGCPEVLS